MKEPKSKLPWKGEDIDDLKSNNKKIIDTGYSNADCLPEDFDYIIQACNNFPKAVELLKESVLQLEYLNSFEREHGTTNKVLLMLSEFLKSLEE